MAHEFVEKLLWPNGAACRKCGVALISRDTDDLYVPSVPNVIGATLKDAIRQHVDKSATLYTDGFGSYAGIGKEFEGGHHTVNHGARESEVAR